MYAPLVSVVVASRERPEALGRCLTALSQQVWPCFEVIVVACPAGSEAVTARDDAASIRLIPFDHPNISQARNLGVAAAAGEIVAFIDDDALAEPLWLSHLIAPFQDVTIAATTGYVIGRNGISFQWQAQSVDREGEAHPILLPDTAVATPKPPRKQAIKLEGTNMAIRRALLMNMGGFDVSYRYFLDETDLAMRLMLASQTVAIVPLAQVHHRFAASARRAADRRPVDLTEIGASKAVFLRRFAPKRRHKPAWKAFREEQRRRALKWMQSGPFGADDVLRLMRGLKRGWTAGRHRELSDLAPLPDIKDLPDQAGSFHPYPGRPGAGHVVIGGLWRERNQVRDHAQRLVKTGATVTVILLTRGRRSHNVTFTDAGYWEQTGGLLGSSIRNGRTVQLWTRRKRVVAEAVRVAGARGAYEIVNPASN